jgi:hypothetical protein
MEHVKNLRLTLRRSYSYNRFRDDVRQRRSGASTPDRRGGHSGTAVKKLCQ